MTGILLLDQYDNHGAVTLSKAKGLNAFRFTG